MADRRVDETSRHRPELDETRREALAKMGRLAGYTAPVMLGLLGATKARASPRAARSRRSRPQRLRSTGDSLRRGPGQAGSNSSAPGWNWSGQRVA